ncbi:DnaD domain protein [Halobacillus sp. A5]|uniref:DnaD domain protein n=1 Tax=Halobacillus sp. A5 TaxID=2880263 RepID=UPI0020A6C29D|nr:DnaD domain protein [Halobacillus sp. A5]MCP3026635.1 DnaD domain protein [Halobacillus sp. A5]
MKNTYYFSHDGNARNDPKILSMRSVYGSEGYGWYWIIIEMLREQNDYKIKINKYTWNALAMQLQCNADAAHRFASDCINEFELLHTDGEYFWSESLLKRMEVKDTKSEKAKKAAQARWKKKARQDGDSSGKSSEDKKSNAKDMQPHSERNADAMPNKEKKSKVNESKEKKSKEDEEKKKEPATSTDAIRFYQNNFGMLRPQTSEEIMAWIQDLGDDMVTEAMKRALDRNKPSWGYAKSILQSWANKNIQTLEQAQAEEVEFKNKQQRGFAGSKSSEVVPEWFNKQDEQKQSSPANNQKSKIEKDAQTLYLWVKTKKSLDEIQNQSDLGHYGLTERDLERIENNSATGLEVLKSKSKLKAVGS